MIFIYLWVSLSTGSERYTRKCYFLCTPWILWTPKWADLKLATALLLLTAGNLKASCLFYTQIIPSSFTSTTMAINKPYMGPSIGAPLIETSGDNFLEEQSDWLWTGMPMTSDPEAGLFWHESWPVVTFRVLPGPSVVLSHIGLPLMSIGVFSHGPRQSRPLKAWGVEGVKRLPE